jgi:hypothetical protein
MIRNRILDSATLLPFVAMPSDHRPSTPPIDATEILQSLSIQSTPHSHGSSSHYSYQSQNQQSNYRPYLIEDLKHQYTITFDEFLNEVLHLPLDWIEQNASKISNIIHLERYGNTVSKYRELVAHETSRYPPFLVLVNHVMDYLGHKPLSNCHFAATTRSLLEVREEETRRCRRAPRDSRCIGEIVCRQHYEGRTKRSLFLVDRTVVVLRVQARSQRAVSGFGSGFSDKGSQFEYVLLSGFAILLLD